MTVTCAYLEGGVGESAPPPPQPLKNSISLNLHFKIIKICLRHPPPPHQTQTTVGPPWKNFLDPRMGDIASYNIPIQSVDCIFDDLFTISTKIHQVIQSAK